MLLGGSGSDLTGGPRGAEPPQFFGVWGVANFKNDFSLYKVRGMDLPSEMIPFGKSYDFHVKSYVFLL